MFNKIKKSFTIALAVVMAFASVAACATSAKLIDYDIDGFLGKVAAGFMPGTIDNVYQIFDDNGVMIAQVKGQEAFATFGLPAYSPIDVKNPWVSKEYPNKEYSDLYVNGKRIDCLQGFFATGRFGLTAGVKYRNVDYMWEAAAPHRIYSKTQAYLMVNGAAQWYTNASYPVQYTGRNAQVKAERIYYGFGDYKVTGNDAIALAPAYMAPWVGEDVFDGFIGITPEELAPKATQPAVLDVTGRFIAVPKSYDIKLVGPGFDAEGNQIPDAKTIIGTDITTCNPADLAIDDVLGVVKDTAGNITYAKTEYTNVWTDPNHKFGHYKWLWLTIDGVVMDGRYEPAGDFYRPAIATRIVYGCEHCENHGGICDFHSAKDYPNASPVEYAINNNMVYGN